MSRLVFKSDKAKSFLRRIDASYQERALLFRHFHANEMNAPQHKNIPKGLKKGSLEYNRWLFFATLLNYRSVSEKVFPMAVTLWDKFPGIFSKDFYNIENIECFDLNQIAAKWRDNQESKVIHFSFDDRIPPVVVIKLISDLITVALNDKDVRYTSPNQGGQRWAASAVTLFDYFDGNPLNIFSQVNSVNEFLLLKERLKKEEKPEAFLGYGPKLFSLLAIFYEELGLIKHLDGSFPVDLHIQRIFLSLGIVEGLGDNEHDAMGVAEFIRPRLTELCYELGIKPLDLSHALWFLGSRVCLNCTKINKSTRELCCPLVEFCPGPVKSRAYAKRGRWDLDERYIFDQGDNPDDFSLVLQ